MNSLDIIDEHVIIRETVGYDLLKEVPIEDMPVVMNFLKVVYNYNRMNRKLIDEIVERREEKMEGYRANVEGL